MDTVESSGLTKVTLELVDLAGATGYYPFIDIVTFCEPLIRICDVETPAKLDLVARFGCWGSVTDASI